MDLSFRRLGPRAAVALVGGSPVAAAVASRYVSHRLAFSRACFVGVAVELLVLAAWRRRRVGEVLRNFLTESDHPLNLAVFRIAVFLGILHEIHIGEIQSFARMPPGLRFAPWGMGRLLPILPIRPALAAAAAAFLMLFALTGLLGLFSRTSALACALLGVYVLGIPDFYGKVDHNHHVLWFAAILAASRCGDSLAIDSWRTGKRGAPSREYALPLRFAMLLTGVIYFFPGFWKFWQSGFDWILNDGLRDQLHLFWTWSFGGSWLPAFRIDRHPRLLELAATAAVLFELSFPLFLFSRRRRGFVAVAGLLFHLFTNAFMRISFLSLRLAYVMFFDWAAIARRARNGLSRTIRRPPSSRTESSPPVPAGAEKPASLFPATLVGCALLAGAVWAGAGRRINGWPFACYPTFSRPPAQRAPALGMVAVDPTGREIPIREIGLSEHRLYGLARNLLAIEDARDRDRRLSLLGMRAVQTRPELRDTISIRFYVESLSIDPDLWRWNPVERKLLFVEPARPFPPTPNARILRVTEWQ